MIRHPITCSALRSEIQNLAPNWLTESRKVHTKFLADRKFSECTLTWSSIKSIYMRLQFNKCAYCERRLEEFSIEHDMEHFRPKSSVKIWPDAKQSDHPTYFFNTGSPMSSGYFWLAYAPWNYASTCKSCNSALKANFFPIAGQRGQSGHNILRLRTERAFLIYPIGYLDEDPENLITFDGIAAIPRHTGGEKYRRARVTIDFFRLNGRDLLAKERAEQICKLGNELKRLKSNLSARDQRKIYRGVMNLCSASSPHAACKRTFHRLWYSNARHAQLLLHECEEISTR